MKQKPSNLISNNKSINIHKGNNKSNNYNKISKSNNIHIRDSKNNSSINNNNSSSNNNTSDSRNDIKRSNLGDLKRNDQLSRRNLPWSHSRGAIARTMSTLMHEPWEKWIPNEFLISLWFKVACFAWSFPSRPIGMSSRISQSHGQTTPTCLR